MVDLIQKPDRNVKHPIELVVSMREVAMASAGYMGVAALAAWIGIDHGFCVGVIAGLGVMALTLISWAIYD